jgi:hypothetical protein
VSNEPLGKKKQAAGGTTRRAHALNALPWLWLGLSAVWAVVIFTTNQVAWPLALWIATTVGPLSALKTRLDPNTDPQRSNQ